MKYDANIFEDERMLNKQFGIDYYSGKTSVKGHSATFVVGDKQNAGFILVYNKKNTYGIGTKPQNKITKAVVQDRDLPNIPVDLKTAKEIITSSINKDKLEMLSHTEAI